MMVSEYLSHYEVTKVMQASLRFNACGQLNFKRLYLSLLENELHLKNKAEVNSKELTTWENPEGLKATVDWAAKFAKLYSRKAFVVSSLVKLNPHESDCTKNIISSQISGVKRIE